MGNGGPERVTTFHETDLIDSKPRKIEHWSSRRASYQLAAWAAAVLTSHPHMKQPVVRRAD